jgi:ornithine decarboxylase
VKCNPDPYVLRLLAALGVGFDCASSSEITNVLNISPGSVDPSRIIFANPCKATSSIRSAARANVNLMTFDNIDELHKIARVHRDAKLVVRILADDSKSRIRLGAKFGAPLAIVPMLLTKAKELSLDVVGVSFHVGSACSDPMAFADAIRRARAVFNMGVKVGYVFDLLDVGGGFEDTSFEETAGVLMHALDEHFPDRIFSNGSEADRSLGMKGMVRVIAEPGRFYVSRAFRLAVNIIARCTPFEVDLDCNANDSRGEVEDQEENKKDRSISVGECDDNSPRIMCEYGL